MDAFIYLHIDVLGVKSYPPVLKMLEYMTYGSGGIFTFRVAPPYVRQLLDEPLKKWYTCNRGRVIELGTERAFVLEYDTLRYPLKKIECWNS